ncbi:uncharacterized protein LOC144689488 [Cetorhinus maximus]
MSGVGEGKKHFGPESHYESKVYIELWIQVSVGGSLDHDSGKEDREKDDRFSKAQILMLAESRKDIQLKMECSSRLRVPKVEMDSSDNDVPLSTLRAKREVKDADTGRKAKSARAEDT